MASLLGRPADGEAQIAPAAPSSSHGGGPTLAWVPEPDVPLSAPEPELPFRPPAAGEPAGWRLDDPASGWAVGLVAAAIGWLVGMVGGAITAGIVLAASGVDEFDDLSLGMVAVAQLGLWFGLLGVPYLAARVFGDGLRRSFGLDLRWRDLPVGVLWGAVGQVSILPLVYLPMRWLTDITQEEFSEPAQSMADKATSPVAVVLLVLIVGVGAPIVEEIFYRGLLQRSLVRRLGPVWGIGIASVTFGAVHFQPLQFPGLALVGVLFGLLAHRSGRLGPAIVAHVVFNMTAVVLLLAGS